MEKFLGSTRLKVEENNRKIFYVLGLRKQLGSRGIFAEGLRYSICGLLNSTLSILKLKLYVKSYLEDQYDSILVG